MKKFILVLVFIVCTCFGIYYAATKNVTVLMNRELKISYNGNVQEFQNANGEKVYPISYDGTTYVPIRSVSTLFSQKIKWDGETNSIFIGEGELDTGAAKAVNHYVTASSIYVEAKLNEDIKIYYKNEIQTFRDVNQKQVYPLSYNGTTYLPVRAISNLFNTDINWDSSTNTVFIGNNDSIAKKHIIVLLNRELKILYDGNIQEFQNVNGEKVYPISYEGTTYIPIRSISSLFGQKIKWDGNTYSVYIGEGELDTKSAKTVSSHVGGSNENIDVLLNEDVKIYYNGKVQTFKDVNGKVVYPLSYNGTTYLPVRAVSNLFNIKIDWDGTQNAVLIGGTINEEVEEDEEVVYEESDEEVAALDLSEAEFLDAVEDSEEKIYVDLNNLANMEDNEEEYDEEDDDEAENAEDLDGGLFDNDFTE